MRVINIILLIIGLIVVLFGILFVFVAKDSRMTYNAYVTELKSTHRDFESISQEKLQLRFEEERRLDTATGYAFSLAVILWGTVIATGGWVFHLMDKYILKKRRAEKFNRLASKEKHGAQNDYELNEIKMGSVNQLTSMLRDSALQMDKPSMTVLGDLIADYIEEND